MLLVCPKLFQFRFLYSPLGALKCLNCGIHLPTDSLQCAHLGMGTKGQGTHPPQGERETEESSQEGHILNKGSDEDIQSRRNNGYEGKKGAGSQQAQPKEMELRATKTRTFSTRRMKQRENRQCKRKVKGTVNHVGHLGKPSRLDNKRY